MSQQGLPQWGPEFGDRDPRVGQPAALATEAHDRQGQTRGHGEQGQRAGPEHAEAEGGQGSDLGDADGGEQGTQLVVPTLQQLVGLHGGLPAKLRMVDYVHSRRVSAVSRPLRSRSAWLLRQTVRERREADPSLHVCLEKEQGPVPTILENVALVAGTAIVAAILAAWAHAAQRSHRLAVALYVVFTLLSLGLITVGVLAISGGVPEGYVFLALGIGVALPLVGPLRRLLARFMPFDPNSKPDMVGLSLLLGIALGLTAIFIVAPSVNVTAVSVPELVAQAVTFVLISYLGVGVLISRTVPSATQRLGLQVPTLRQTVIALALVFVLYLSSTISTILTGLIQPELYKELEQGLLLPEQVSTFSSALILGLFVGLSTGIGEEVFFRGAIQPRYGIIFTSLVFALFHVQYGGLSLVMLDMFLSGIVFGLERQRMNTTTAIITHLVFNTIVVVEEFLLR